MYKGGILYASVGEWKEMPSHMMPLLTDKKDKCEAL